MLDMKKVLRIWGPSHDAMKAMWHIILGSFQLQAFSLSYFVASELTEQLLQLQISSASLARKQQNYNLAEQLILEQSKLLLPVSIDENSS